MRDAAAYLVGPTGFLLLGLSRPARPRASDAGTRRSPATVAIAVKVARGPGRRSSGSAGCCGADVPDAFYLSAAVPGAFHLLVIARVYDLRPVLMRAMVVVSSLAMLLAVAIWALLRGPWPLAVRAATPDVRG